jgi:hypothetical protein
LRIGQRQARSEPAEAIVGRGTVVSGAVIIGSILGCVCADHASHEELFKDRILQDI